MARPRFEQTSLVQLSDVKESISKIGTPMRQVCNFQYGTTLVTGYCYKVVSYKASHATETIFWPTVLPIWVLIIPDSYTTVLWSGCRVKVGGKWSLNFAHQYLSRHLQHAVKAYDKGPMAYLSFLRKSCYRFLLLLKINHSQPCLNHQTLALTASTITITPLRMTETMLRMIRRGSEV
jgi:hypothetical protein